MFPENITKLLGQAGTEINALTVFAYISNLKFFAEVFTPIKHLIPHQISSTANKYPLFFSNIGRILLISEFVKICLNLFKAVCSASQTLC